MTTAILYHCRYVLDGWPVTKEQVDLLNKHRMILVCIIELQVTDEECLKRGEIDRKSPSRYNYYTHYTAGYHGNVVADHSPYTIVIVFS